MIVSCQPLEQQFATTGRRIGILGVLTLLSKGKTFHEDRRQEEMDRHAARQEQRPGRPRKYKPTKRTDRIIRAAYLDSRKGADPAVVQRAAARLGWPRQAVARRAAELGVAGSLRERPWSEHESAIVEGHSKAGAETIRQRLRHAGFQRSARSILAEKKRLKIETGNEWYSARQAAAGLGVDPHKVIRWIKKGLLVAKRGKHPTSPWSIKANDLRDFVFAHPEQIALGQADQLWLLKVLRGSFTPARHKRFTTLGGSTERRARLKRSDRSVRNWHEGNTA